MSVFSVNPKMSLYCTCPYKGMGHFRAQKKLQFAAFLTHERIYSQSRGCLQQGFHFCFIQPNLIVLCPLDNCYGHSFLLKNLFKKNPLQIINRQCTCYCWLVAHHVICYHSCSVKSSMPHCQYEVGGDIKKKY